MDNGVFFIPFFPSEPDHPVNEPLKALISELINQRLPTAQTVTEADVLLTRSEAAKFCKVSPLTISNWINGGLLTNHGLGRKIAVSKNELKQKQPKRFNR